MTAAKYWLNSVSEPLEVARGAMRTARLTEAPTEPDEHRVHSAK